MFTNRNSLQKRSEQYQRNGYPALFGDHYFILETGEGWIKIKIAYDNYECWINVKQHTKIGEATFNQIQKQATVYSTELIQVISNKKTNTNFPISIGATLPLLKDNGV